MGEGGGSLGASVLVMTDQPISVLKFGSSVLGSEVDLPLAALEIYGEVRKGHRVVAVVSAFGGATDRLLQTARRHFADPRSVSLARLLGTGETVAAASLGMLLDDAGVPNAVLDPHEVGLRTRGPVLDAEPDGLDVGALRRMLCETSVVILSGFVGQCGDGSPSLLGRGGSDLTAIFLAHRLEARTCRLLKDVDGLYTGDPHESHTACRYRTASWEEALRVGGALIQPKAVRYAREWELSFTVCRPGSGVGTKVGPGPPRCETRPAHRPPLRVGLAGLGTVGLGVYRWLKRRSEQFDIVAVLVDDVAKERPDDVVTSLLTDDPWALLDRPLDVVVEVIGGTETAAVVVGQALAQGLDVVTANKTLLASNPEYVVGSESLATRLACSASVGGAVPVLERLSHLTRRSEIEEIEGVLNGTCNYVLDKLSEGYRFSEAIEEAQAQGFAERDPSQDVSGRDAACKLAVIAAATFGVAVHPDEIRCRGIDGVTPEAAQQARAGGSVVRSHAHRRRLARARGPCGRAAGRSAGCGTQRGECRGGSHQRWQANRVAGEGRRTMAHDHLGGGRSPGGVSPAFSSTNHSGGEYSLI